MTFCFPGESDRRVDYLFVVALTIAMIFTPSVRAQQEVHEESLPTLTDVERPPTFENLMNANPFDWIVLKTDERVIISEPLSPRPNTLARLKKELEDLRSRSRLNAEQRERLVNLKKLPIRLPDDPEDYLLDIQEIAQIIGIEDLMLERATLLTDAGDIAEAWDLLRQVEDLLPDWDQAQPVFENLLLKEAELTAQRGDTMAALALLDELHSRNPNRPEVAERMSGLLQPLLQSSIEQEDYGRARWLIGRMERHFPEHSLVTDARATLSQLASEWMKRATEQSARGEHRAAVVSGRLAESIEPSRGKTRAAWNRILARYQIVRVGVASADRPAGRFPVPLPAELRHQELTTVSLFEADSVDELTHYTSTHVDEWDPTDLGRQVTLVLPTSRPYWQSQPLLSAGLIAETLSAYLNPQDPLYNPRLASFVSGYTVRSPSRIEVWFSRVPLNMAALFRFPVVGTAVRAEGDGDEHHDASAGRVVQSTRFVTVDSSAEPPSRERRYVRSIPEPDGLSPALYHMAEIIEREYSSRHECVQAFFRSDIDVLAELTPWEVDPITRSGRGTVVKQALPHTHLIVFNPRSEIVRNAQLRRAISLAIDRESLLRRIVLRSDTLKYGRLTAAPWPTDSYARNPLVEPPDSNPRLAFALRFAAEEQQRIPERRRLIDAARRSAEEAGDDWDEVQWRAENEEQLRAATAHIRLPTLRLIHEPNELVHDVTHAMLEAWKRVGIDVEVVDPVAGDLTDSWDMIFRRVSMEEPLFDLWPVLLTDHSLDVTLLRGYPDWLRQALTRLDYAGSARDAKDQLYRLQRDLTVQAFLIPLWEVDRFIAFRNNITGYRERPLGTYDNAERWMVTP